MLSKLGYTCEAASNLHNKLHAGANSTAGFKCQSCEPDSAPRQVDNGPLSCCFVHDWIGVVVDVVVVVVVVALPLADLVPYTYVDMLTC